MKRFKRPKPGGQISARQLGELQRAVEAMMHPAGVSGARTGAVPAYTRGGVIHDSSVYQPFWAKLTSKTTDLDGATCYAFQEIYKDPASVTQTHTIGRSGDGQTIRSYEVRGIDVPQADIDAGRAIVLLWLGYDGPPGTYYLFWYGSGTGGTGNVQTATHNSQQNNFVLNTSTTWLQINATGAFALTGLAIGWQGRIVQITNVGTASIELPHLSSSSTSYASASESAEEDETPVGNQFYIRTGCSAFLQPGESTLAKYVDGSAGVKNVWVIEPFPTHVGGVAIKTGTSYTATQDDHGKLLVFTSSSNITLTLPTSPYPSCDWFVDVWNVGAGVSTLLTVVDGSGTNVYVLANQGTRIFSTGAAYRYQPGSTNFNFEDVGDANRTLTVGDSGKLMSFNPTAANRTATLPDPNTLRVVWAVDVENRGTKLLTLTPAAGTISGLSSVHILPRQSVCIHTDKSNYFVARGRPWTGVIEITTSPYDLSPKDSGKILAWMGSGKLVVREPAGGNAKGMRFALRNSSSSAGAIVEYTTSAGVVVADIAPGRGYELFVPDNDDSGTTAILQPGLSLFGVRRFSSADNLTRADVARDVVFEGITAVTLSLFEPNLATHTQDYLFACAVRNLGTELLTIAPSADKLIDGQTVLTLLPCQGVWLFTDGINWFTERGRPCAGVQEISTSPYTVGATDHGKILAWTGTGTLVLNEPAGGLPWGLRVRLRNSSSDPAALVAYTLPSGVVVTDIPPGRGYDLTAPEANDGTAISYLQPGMPLYGVRRFSSSASVTRADWARNLVYEGSGAATLTLFNPDNTAHTSDYLWAFAVRNLSSDNSVLTVATSSGKTIDGVTSVDIRWCEGIWIFTDGTNWYTVPGRFCAVATSEPSSLINGNVWTDSCNLKYRCDGATYTTEKTSNKDVSNGYAGLDSNGKISSSVLPDNLDSGTGTTTDSYVTVLTITNSFGLWMNGNFGNTGGSNSMDLRMSWVDDWGGSGNEDVGITAGNNVNLSVPPPFTGSRSPTTTIAYKVKSSLAGSSTTYAFKISSNG